MKVMNCCSECFCCLSSFKCVIFLMQGMSWLKKKMFLIFLPFSPNLVADHISPIPPCYWFRFTAYTLSLVASVRICHPERQRPFSSRILSSANYDSRRPRCWEMWRSKLSSPPEPIMPIMPLKWSLTGFRFESLSRIRNPDPRCVTTAN